MSLRKTMDHHLLDIWLNDGGFRPGVVAFLDVDGCRCVCLDGESALLDDKVRVDLSRDDLLWLREQIDALLQG